MNVLPSMVLGSVLSDPTSPSLFQRQVDCAFVFDSVVIAPPRDQYAGLESAKRLIESGKSLFAESVSLPTSSQGSLARHG